jgi:hypothetical protein
LDYLNYSLRFIFFFAGLFLPTQNTQYTQYTHFVGIVVPTEIKEFIKKKKISEKEFGGSEVSPLSSKTIMVRPIFIIYSKTAPLPSNSPKRVAVSPSE